LKCHLRNVLFALYCYVNLPGEVPVMVLPSSILFPGAMLPIHVFEKKYRKMLADSLSSHRLFCISTFCDDTSFSLNDKHIHDIVGVGIIRVALENPDGSSNIIIQGISRARVLDFVEGKPYPRAHLELLSPQTQGEETMMVDALTEKVAELATIRAKLDKSITAKTLKFLIALRDPSALSDLISFSLLGDWHDQQKLLETLNVETRLRKLILLLKREIERIRIMNSLKRKMIKKKIELN
jgi:Lon protease-like protein